MDDRTTQQGTSLYDQDFYAWTQEQAALLRSGRVTAADLPNISEEIETLGRKELAELRSRLRVLAAHLLKEIYQRGKSSRSWKTTILNQRIAIAAYRTIQASSQSSRRSSPKLTKTRANSPRRKLDCRSRRFPTNRSSPARRRSRDRGCREAACRAI